MSSEENWDEEDNQRRNWKKPSAASSSMHQQYRSDNFNRYNTNGENGFAEVSTETVNVPRNSIGMVIGRKGANIKRIQDNFTVRIRVDTENCTAKISGRSQRNVKKAVEEIMRTIESASKRARENYERYTSAPRYNECRSHSPNRDKYESITSKSYSGNGDAVSESNESQAQVIDWDAMNKRAELERKKRWEKCPPLLKNFYRECYEVKNMSDEDVAKLRAEYNNVMVSRVFKKDNNTVDDIPNPIWRFEQCFQDYPDMLGEIMKQGFQKPSPIQAQAWPILLKGEDMIGIAQTGTGKTLAFLLPAMIHTQYQSIPRGKRGGPNVLVLAPTRELALQIEKEVNKYAFRGMKALCIYGGGNLQDQIKVYEQNVEIIICTPGRLNDFIERKVVDITSVTYLVLDEADRLLDMGFEPQIHKILIDIRPDRQTVMTSATWPPGVRRLAQSYMNNPIQVVVGSLDLAATHSVNQIIQFVTNDEKYAMIKEFIRNMEDTDKVIIFCRKKCGADNLSSDLTIDGFQTQCIHGSRDQADREQAIEDISTGQVRILIATDVASRGLDIEDITHVINYDFPGNIEEYVHRVGRTGRAGRLGTSISYITREDWKQAKELIRILEEADQEVPEELRQMAERYAAMQIRMKDEMSHLRGHRGRRGGRSSNDFGLWQN